METTLDVFLDGRVEIGQPKQGYRAATDPVFLAASVPIRTGQSVLDVGCGVGTAAICLGARVKDVRLTGIEMQSAYAQLAAENATRNGLNISIENADLSQLSAVFRQQSFDHVMTNPPFFEPSTLSNPQSVGKSIAHVETMTLGDWISLALRRLHPKGTFTIIHLAQRLPEILHALNGPCGDLRVLPIAPREGRMAKRVIVQGVKTAKAPLQILPPFVVHAGTDHIKDGDDYSNEARSILRNGQALQL
jgi:tRNA1(Val) A37 N6-methylase TrmN6